MADRPARPPGIDGIVKPHQTASDIASPGAGAVTATSVQGVTLHQMHLAVDVRGSITAGEFPAQLPFLPKRYFLVFAVPGQEVRGEHAHRRCHQFLVCASGSVTVLVDDGTTREEIVLDRPDVGLYVPPMIWSVQNRYSSGALLLVLASDPYDPADYIRDYDEFLSAVRP